MERAVLVIYSKSGQLQCTPLGALKWRHLTWFGHLWPAVFAFHWTWVRLFAQVVSWQKRWIIQWLQVWFDVDILPTSGSQWDTKTSHLKNADNCNGKASANHRSSERSTFAGPVYQLRTRSTSTRERLGHSQNGKGTWRTPDATMIVLSNNLIMARL